MSKQTKVSLAAFAILALVLVAGFAWQLAPGGPGTDTADGDGRSKSPVAEAREDPEELREAARAAGANELGQVPILVYHQIGPQEGRWTRTPDNFRRDLQELHDRGYVLVPLNDYLDGNIDIPAGKSPAVLTFDDGTAGHFRLLEQDGEAVVDPDCAVGILQQFGEEHPGFGHAATFFVNARPFGQPQLWQEKLRLLDEWDFEIGNHTYSHKYLKGLAPEEAGAEIARLQTHVQEAVPGYAPRAFAIVQDGVPDPIDIALRGESHGTMYEHDGVLWWAWSAAPSPHHRDYDPTRIQRIQVFEDNGRSSLVNWLDRISATRYVSDGRTDTIAIPDGWQEALAESHDPDKDVIVYITDAPQRTPGLEQQAAGARGVHVSFFYASSPERWQQILTLVEEAGLNTLQLDVKDESGRLGYISRVPLAQEIDANQGFLPIEDMLSELRERGLYSVARIVVIRDPYLARHKPEYMVRNKNGAPFGGGVWVDIYSKDVWDYNIALAREAYELGFDEVQFDYIRFPEGHSAKTAVYPARGGDGRHRVDVLSDWLAYAREELGWHRMFSAAVFGFIAHAVDDVGIGQRPERMAPFLDYISPMVYPSHYSRGNYGFANPNAHPYEIVSLSLQDFEPLIEASGCRLRPWLQSFTLGSPPYGRTEIRAQIEATRDNGIDTWLLWDPRVAYQTENIVP
ncbi:MAG: polysaccharide deacetylase family protein [Candidatus Desulforudis sp.]|nr:polysaccharide deacetylase family protein [Desulforudis sp.]